MIIYLFPIILDFKDPKDQYFHNVLWFFYLIPTLILAFNKGTFYGGIATGTACSLFLIIEYIQAKEFVQHDLIMFIVLTIVNILITFAVGILVKRNNEKQVQLNETKNLLERILNNLDIGIWSLNQNQNFLTSKGIGKIYGLSHKYELNNNDFWRRSIHPEDQYITEEIDKKWEEMLDYEYEYRINRPNGEIRWILDRGIPVFKENGEFVRYDGTNVDITRQKELEFSLKESEEKYKHLLEKALVGVYLIQHNEIIYINQWFRKFIGLAEQELLGADFIEFIKKEERVRVIANFKKLIEGQETFFIDEIQIITQDGTTRYLELQATLTTINGSKAISGIALDVTDKKKTKDELVYIAYHDAQTGLPNMLYLTRYVTEEFNLSKTAGKPICMMFFNLDRFKLINDSFGHQTGDQLLRMIATRLKKSTNHIGTVLRAGGDEFIIYLPDTNPSQAKDFARLLLKSFSEPFHLNKQEIRIAASIGIAIVQKNDTLDDAVQKASTALHFAKESGRNRYQFYSFKFGELSNRRLQLEQGLRKALEYSELELFYQPKLDIFTNQITGMEALMRWNNPLLGEVSPMEFIPIAEETGMIISIGKWALETACKDNSEWQRNRNRPLHVCVNISSKQFLQEDFVEMIEQILTESKLSPDYLNLEITEGIALYNIKDAISKLEKLKRLGVSISLDDFGTGYSSLSYIKSLPIDYLKIDRTFINGIFENNEDVAIINSIITLSQSLGLRVVAEGVEDEQQLMILKRMRCDEIQGFYYSKPMSSIHFEQFLHKMKEEATEVQ